MIGAAATASGVTLLLALKMPLGGTSSVEAGGVVPPAAGTGGGVAGGQTVLGDAADTQYGEVQVRLVLSGGRIMAVEAVKAPSSEARSKQITADAIPRLNQAAVAAQSAQIDAVSGASYTSQGYLESLQSALDKTGTAGGGEPAGTGGSGSGSVEAGGSASGAAEAGSSGGDSSDVGSSDAGSSGTGSSDAGSSDAGSSGTRTVLGKVANTDYGPVQVRITVSGGKVTAAEAVQSPSADANSRSIAADAVPRLNQAAVAAQSAQIDAVSGASYTSQGYLESLQSALDKAGV
jgi:uncharacterized protein with FMN-binding domain